MQKFFTKAFSLIIGLAVTFNLLGSLAERVAPLDDWRNEYQTRLENLKAKRNRIQAVTIGNSHSDSINYSVLNVEGQSLALPYADFFETERLAASIQDKLPMLKTVFITISYHSFSRDNATFEPFRTRRMEFYSMVPAWSPIRGDVSIFELGKLDALTHVLDVVRSDSWQGVWTRITDAAAATGPSVYDGVRTHSIWGDCLHYTEPQLEIHAQDTAGRHISSSRQMAHVHPGLAQDAAAALARTIASFQSRGVRVILFTPAYYQKYNALFAEQGSDIVRDMRQNIQSLQQTYHVEYYDFSSDPEITITSDLFYNSDHLSECGTRAFTEKLLGAINANGGLDK